MADDVKEHINSSHDFYDLLGVTEGAQETEIRRAYRKTALKYHPDKVGADATALDKFHLLQIAYDILSDPTARELYDNARRAKEARSKRDQAYEGRRKWMKEELERKEGDSLKRKRGDEEEDEALQKLLVRLAEDGRRRRKEREEQLRKEALDLERASTVPTAQGADQTRLDVGAVSAADRAVAVRLTSSYPEDELAGRFERFGRIEGVSIREKKVKIDGEKHRRKYNIATIVFKDIAAARAAVRFRDLMLDQMDGVLESIDWATGKQPDCVPSVAPSGLATNAMRPDNGDKDTRAAPSGPIDRELLMMRLKNAGKRQAEERSRRQEAETAQNTPS